MAGDLEQLGKLIVAQLTPDLLAPQFSKMSQAERNSLFGHCYVASESLYHLAGAKRSGLRPRRVRIADGHWHWWLVDREGNVIDLTAGQFENPPDYAAGVRAAFLSKRPSVRAKKLMARVVAAALKDVTPANIDRRLPRM
jgi:hypothetical protein